METANDKIFVDKLDSVSQCPKELALFRIDTLDGKSETDLASAVGIAEELVRLLQKDPTLSLTLKILKTIQNIAKTDVTLLEEIFHSQGFGKCLKDLKIRSEILLESGIIADALLLKSLLQAETQLEASMSKLDLSTDRSTSFTLSELEKRLPLKFSIPKEQQVLEIMVHQVTLEEETNTHDTGFVMWPSSVVLARHLAENPAIVLDFAAGRDHLDVLELGSGCGFVGLTAAKLLQQRRENSKEDDIEGNSTSNGPNVIFTDYCTTVLENIERNLDLNGLSDVSKVAGLDFFDQPGNYDSKYDVSQANWIDMQGNERPQVGLIVAADIICYSNDAANVANTINAALVNGGRAIVMSAGDNRRFGLEKFPGACEDVGLEINVKQIKASENKERKEHFKLDMQQTIMQGYTAANYNLTMFDIKKP